MAILDQFIFLVPTIFSSCLLPLHLIFFQLWSKRRQALTLSTSTTDLTHYHYLNVLSKLTHIPLPRSLSHVQHGRCKTDSLSQTHGLSTISAQILTHNSELTLCSYSSQSVSHPPCSQVHSFSLSNVLPLAPKFVFYSCFLSTHLYAFEHLPSFHGFTQDL